MDEEQTTSGFMANLTKEQKIGFFLLLVFAILSIGLGILQIRNTLYAPFALNNTVPATIKDDVTGIDSLRYRDTDHDGLSDFDELYQYNTSPYLYDTFGYGMSDKEMLAKGLPLCPKGQDCTAPAESNSDVTLGTSTESIYVPAPEQTPPIDLYATFQDPKQVRTLLANSGLSKSVLDKVSDADLMIMVRQLLANSSTLSNIQALNSFIGISSSARVATGTR